MDSQKRFRNERGFSLFEMVMVVVLMGIMGSIIATTFAEGVKAYYFVNTRKNLLEQAQSGLMRLVREMRMCHRISGIRPSPVYICIESPLNPYTNSEGGVYGGISSLSYVTYGSGKIGISSQYLVQWGTDTTLIDNVSSFAIRCFDENGIDLCVDPANYLGNGFLIHATVMPRIRRILFEVEVRIPKSGGGYTTEKLYANVHLQALRYME